MLAKTPKRRNPIDLHVANRIKSARIQARKSQEAVADVLGLTFQQVQKYEKGTNRISAGRLAALANLYDVPVSWFFDGAPEYKGTSTPARDVYAELLTTPMGGNLATNFLAIPDNSTRAIVVAMVAKLAGQRA